MKIYAHATTDSFAYITVFVEDIYVDDITSL